MSFCKESLKGFSLTTGFAQSKYLAMLLESWFTQKLLLTLNHNDIILQYEEMNNNCIIKKKSFSLTLNRSHMMNFK